MSDDEIRTADRDALLRNVDALSQLIDQRIREFNSRGELTPAQQQISALAARHRQIRQRLEAAQGAGWESSKADLARAHDALYREFVAFEDKLDSEAMRDQPPGRAPGAKSGLV